MIQRSPPGSRPRRPARRAAWPITLTYILVSVAWIVLSDITMLGLGTADRPVLNLSLLKGLFWVTASGLLLHVLVFKQLERVRSDEAAAHSRLVEAEEIGGFGASEAYAGSLPEWSDGMFRLWGRARTEGAPERAWLEEKIDPRDLEQARRAAAAAMRGEDSPPYDLHIRAGDGVERVLRISSRSEVDGGRVRSLILAQDVSELRALEHHAGESLRLLRSILESTDEGILVERSDLREILLWNDRFADLTRIPPGMLERLDARDAFDAFHRTLCKPDDARSRMDGIYRTGGGESAAVLELKDGTVLEEYTAPVELERAGGTRIWSYRDVTERFRARATLERRERQLAHAQKIAALGSFEWDPEADDVQWSEELLGLSGLSAPDSRSIDSLLGIALPADRPSLDAAIARARATRRIDPIRCRIARPDGQVRVVEMRGEAQDAGGGEPRLVIGSVQDVTEEHESRRALTEAEERFRATFDQAAVGIAHLSTDGDVVRVNKTLCFGLGYAREELVGLPAASLVHSDDLADAQDRLARINAEESSFETWEMRCIPRDGTPVWVEATLSRARVADGSSYLIAVAQDITRRKAMEAERQALDRKVRLLLESTKAGLVTLDLEGRCTLINRAGCESLGYSEAEVLGRPMGDLIYGSSALPHDARDTVVHANEGRSTKLYNHGFLKSDGSTLPVDVTVSPVFENGVVIGRAVSFVDVSDRKRLEEQLEEAKRIAGLGRVAASIAHEINNVLMGIVPFAEIISRSDEPLFRSAAEQIKQSVQRGRGVTQDILRFAREEKPARAIFAGLPWLESLAPEIREIIRGRGALTMRLPERAFHLEADGPQVSQALMNLVVNARDAIDPEDGTIELTAEIADASTRFPFGVVPPPGRGWVWIRVADNGTGMSSETLAHLFEPFFTTKHGGTGLGLSIAYRIVTAHEGLLFVESALGKGTTFHVLLPESHPPAPVVAEDARERKLPGEVLLVEDDETVAVGLGFILEDAGMRVRIAGSGREALAELARSRPDLMILDVGLPDMHGDEVCEQALAQWPGLPVIFSTGHGDAGGLSAFLEKSHVRFLMKPYTFEQLRDAMERVIDGADSG